MRLPRDLSGSELAQALQKLGYSITRQTGSHLRLTTQDHGQHHLTIPQHNPLRIGTLFAIRVTSRYTLRPVATRFHNASSDKGNAPVIPVSSP